MSEPWWQTQRSAESVREELALANYATFKKQKSPSVFTTTGLFFSEAEHHNEIKEQLYGILHFDAMRP